ncbi:RHS repeat-associated core domain-containing protein, partial [bacterium]
LISVDNGSTASYVYGPEGRRVHEDVGGVVKEFVYGAGGQELTVVNASQGLIAGETYVGGRYLGTQTASAFVWAASDELGTARVRTNASGAPIETDTSWPFGAYLNNVGSVSNLHFTGKYRDGSSGLDYFGARYYDSGLGRFLTPDWSAAPEATPYANLSDPQSLNPYIYEGNNPASDVDKDGHCWPWCTALAGAGIGAVVGGGSEALAEWMRGQPLSASRIEHAAEGGAIAGAIIGAIGPEAAPEAGLDEAGGSAWNKIGGTILGNLVGGAAERKLNGQAVADPKALEIDAGTGALGGTFAAIAGKAVASTAIREAATDAAGVGTSAATREGPAKPVCKENTPCAKGSGPASGAAQPSTGGGAQ